MYKMTGNSKSYISFISLRRICKQLSKACYSNYITKVQESIPFNTNVFWYHVKNINKHDGIPRKMHYNNVSVSSQRDITNLFASFFSQVYVPNIPKTSPSISDVTINPLNADALNSRHPVLGGGADALRARHGSRYVRWPIAEPSFGG
ncbi:hypothetical protein J437_LFUL013026 [Ladona fulva]|uniref:Uncharacterized protein n=1 Tax=Ladona fulva TaxID=123851 RepID=A0A8K0KL97_LADFU|nr:hypothetical protein J437_LFUL013026 [Ladona fulva]